MANGRGGGRTIPSPLGGGLERAAAAIREGLERRDILELRRDELGLRERQVDLAERAGAINSIKALAPFLPPGTTLADLGKGGMQLFQRAFDLPPDMIPGDLELNPETLQQFLDMAGRDFLQTPEGQDLLIPSLRARLGLEPSEDVAELRDLEANMRMGALENILNDPEMTREFTQRALGRDPVRIQFPGDEEAIEFDSPTAANIYAQFRLARERFSFQISMANKEQAADQAQGFVEEIKNSVAEAGHEITTGVIQSKIIPIYNQAAEAGSFEPIQRFLDSDATEGEKLAMRMMYSSISVGEQAFIESLPPQIRNFVLIGRELEEFGGKEMTGDLMPSITRILGEQGIDVAQLVDPFFGSPEIRVSRGSPDAGGGSLTESLRQEVNQVPRDVRIQATLQTLIERDMSREELVAVVGEDIVEAAEAELQAPPEGGRHLHEPGPRAETRPPAGTEEEEESRPSALHREESKVPEGGLNPSDFHTSLRGDVRRLNNLLNLAEQRSGQSRQNVLRAANSLKVTVETRQRLIGRRKAGEAMEEIIRGRRPGGGGG